MSFQPHLRIRWPDGGILPIITPPDATGDDIYKMLRFACGPKQELRLYFNEMPIEKNAQLKSYGIKNNDTIQAHVFTITKDNSQLIKSIYAITREAAKIKDVRMNQNEYPEAPYKVPSSDHSDSSSLSGDANSLLSPNINGESQNQNSQNTVIPPRPSEIPGNPLPMFWKPEDNSYPKRDENQDSRFIQKYNTLEEAGDFFASIGWNKWMW